MYSKSQLRQVPEEVATLLKQLNKEEAISNLHQAQLGTRVPLNEKTMWCETITKEELFVTDDGIIFEVPLHTYSETHVTETSESIPYKTAKEDGVGLKEKDRERELILL